MNHTEKERLFLDLLPQVRMEASKAARRFGGDRQELIQDASLAAWIALDHFDPSMGYQLWTFIASCVRYRLMTSWYTQKRHKRTPAIGLCETEVDHRSNEYREPIEFEQLIQGCRPRDAEILRKQYIEGLSNREIGEQQGCSHQAIGECARRGRGVIRERLEVEAKARELRAGKTVRGK